MIDLIIFAGTVFMGFFAIMNPIPGVSIFLALTESERQETVNKIALQAVITAFIIILVFAIAGHFILTLFGVSFTALKLAGGIIVSLIGYQMLQGHSSNVNRPSTKTIEKTIEEESDREETTVAFAPLATPLLAGPGTIITAMNFSGHGMVNLIITVIVFALLCVITYYAFIFGRKIQNFLGTSALKVITRMMGLVLNVIGIQMFIQGIYSAINDFSFYMQG